MLPTGQNGFRQSKYPGITQRKKEEYKQTQYKIISCSTVSSTIQQLLEANSPNQNYSSVQQLRAIHSQNLTLLKGIQIFSDSLITLNLSSNVITSIQGIQSLHLLQSLQIRNNKLQSLKGIQKCTHLLKIDASNNHLSCFQGLQNLKQNNQLQKIYLPGNLFQQLEELNWLQKCKNLREIVFSKGQKSNPFCQHYGDYVLVLSQHIQNRNVIIDDQKLCEQLRILQDSNFMNAQQFNSQAKENNQRRGTINKEQSDNIEKRPQMLTQPLRRPSNFQKQMPSGFQRGPSSLSNQKMFLTQQEQLYQQTEDMLSLKNEQIQDLKYKTSQLQMQQSSQYKELIKKETEVDRLEGQNRELYKQLQKKQKTLAELHNRIENLLKASTQKNKTFELKNTEIDHLKQHINQLKIQSAQQKALAKDYERRLSQLHEKTLSTIEERALKQDEMKRKYEQVYQENYNLCREKEELKDRMRELTEMLREWEFKYQSKINQLQARHAHERQQLLKEAEQKISASSGHYEHQILRIDDQMRSRVEDIEKNYKNSLEQALEKHKKLKNAYEQKTKNQQEIKIILKSALQKNQQHESIIQQFQQIFIKLKTQVSSAYQNKQNAQKQLNQLKYRQAQETANLQQKISSLSYDKNKLQKQLMDLKETHSALLSQNESTTKYQKLYEDLQAKFEDIQITLDAKQQLLQDKNDTIESLKQQIEALQREGSQKVDQKEFQSLRKKYEKYKKENQQFKEQTTSLIQENDQLRKQNQDCKEIILQFEKMKDTLDKYEKIVIQKDQQLQQLTKCVLDLKNITATCQQETQQTKRQYRRLQNQSSRRQKQLREEIRQVESRHKKELENLKVQNQKYKKNALEQLQTVFLKLQK